jgi:hypothetical protein
MRVTKTFKRANGDRVEVTAGVYTDSYMDKPVYSTYVQFCEKGKRKFHAPMSGQRATDGEINQAHHELWQAMKPPAFFTPDF